MKLDLNDVIKATEATVLKNETTLEKIGFSTDTRTIKVRVEFDPEVTPAQLNAMGENPITLNLSFGLNYVQD